MKSKILIFSLVLSGLFIPLDSWAGRQPGACGYDVGDNICAGRGKITAVVNGTSKTVQCDCKVGAVAKAGKAEQCVFHNGYTIATTFPKAVQCKTGGINSWTDEFESYCVGWAENVGTFNSNDHTTVWDSNGKCWKWRCTDKTKDFNATTGKCTTPPDPVKKQKAMDELASCVADGKKVWNEQCLPICESGVFDTSDPTAVKLSLK